MTNGYIYLLVIVMKFIVWGSVGKAVISDCRLDMFLIGLSQKWEGFETISSAIPIVEGLIKLLSNYVWWCWGPDLCAHHFETLF